MTSRIWHTLTTRWRISWHCRIWSASFPKIHPFLKFLAKSFNLWDFVKLQLMHTSSWVTLREPSIAVYCWISGIWQLNLLSKIILSKSSSFYLEWPVIWWRVTKRLKRSNFIVKQIKTLSQQDYLLRSPKSYVRKMLLCCWLKKSMCWPLSKSIAISNVFSMHKLLKLLVLVKLRQKLPLRLWIL